MGMRWGMLPLATKCSRQEGTVAESRRPCFARGVDELKSLQSFAPDGIMYISLFDVCAKKQNVDEGLRLLDEYERRAFLTDLTAPDADPFEAHQVPQVFACTARSFGISRSRPCAVLFSSVRALLESVVRMC